MRDTRPRMNQSLDQMRTSLAAYLDRAQTTLRLHLAGWRAEVRSLQDREKRRAIWRAARPLLLFAAAYVAAWSYLFVAAFLGDRPPPAPLFPPGAVLFAALLLMPPRRWWQFLVAAFVIQVPILLYLHLPLWWALVGFIPDAVEPVVAASLIRLLLPLPLRFVTLREVSIYTACAAAAVMLGATLGAGVSVAGGEPFWTSWDTWFLGDVLSYLVLAPTLLLWIAAGTGGLRASSRQRFAEAALLYGGLLVLGVIVFDARLRGPDSAHALIYVPVPLLLWAAVRFGPRGIASALSVILVLAIPAVADDSGPFASHSAPAAALLGNIFTLQAFLLVIGVPLFFLAALVQERTRADAALRESEKRYRTVVETQTEMVTRYRPDLTMTFVNDAVCRFVGKPREELLGTSIIADTPAEAAALVREMVEGLLAQPYPGIVTVEHETRFHDGTLRWQQWVNRTILDADGQVIELQGIGRDITERKQAEEARRASEERYRAVVRNLPHSAVLLFDEQLRHTFADGPGLQALELTPETLEGRSLQEAFPTDLAVALAPRYDAALAGQAAELDVEHEQHVYQIQVVPMPEVATAGPASAGMVVLQDVTEQRRTHDELERERTLAALLSTLNQEFRTLAEHSPDFIARLYPSGRFLYINHAGADLLGLPPEQWIGKTFAQVGIPRRIYEPWVEAIREVVATGAPRTFDAEVQPPDGRVLSLHVRFIPEFGDDGTILSVLGIATDVSALKHAEARLAEQASELEAIFEARADGVAVFDLAGRFVRANAALRDLLGFDADADYPSLPLEERARRLQLFDEQGQLLPQEEWPQWRVLRGEILTGADAMEVRARSLDARDLWISITGAPVRTPNGQASGVVLITRDVTARRQLEQQVGEQAARLEAIFEAMADGVLVHDAQGRLLLMNQAYRDLMGLEADPDHFARPLSDRVRRLRLLDEQGQPILVEDSASRRVLGGEVISGQRVRDVQFHTLDGRDAWINTSGAPIRGPDGQITGAVLISRDVTARRALERQVAEQAGQLEAIFEAMADGVVVYDRDEHVVRANRAWQAIFRHYAELTGMSSDPTFAALPFAEQVEQWEQWGRENKYLVHNQEGVPISTDEVPIFRALRGETVTGADAVDERVEGPDGGVYETSVSAAPIRDAAGTIVGAVAVAREVTEQRQLERQVREQAAQLEAIFAAMTDGVFVLDAQGHIVRVNPAAQALFTLTTGEERAPEAIDLTATDRARALALGDSEGRSLPLEQLPTVRLLRGEVFTGDTALTLEFGAHTDRMRSISLTGGPLRDATTGQIVGAVGVVRDVTEFQRVQAALAEQERLFRTLVEHSPDIIARFDREQRYMYISPAIRQISPLPVAAYRGKTNAELGWPEAAYAPAQRAIERVFQTGEPETLEEGSAEFGATETGRYYRAQILPECTDEGHVESVLTMTTDITALKLTEQKLREANASIEIARQEEERRKQIAESLRGVLAILNSTRSPREVLQYIAHQVEELLGSAASVIYGPDDLADTVPPGAVPTMLSVQAAEGLRIGGRLLRLQQRLPFADPAIEQVLASGQPVALVDNRGDTPGGGAGDEAHGHAAIPRLDGTLPESYQALLVVPIRVLDGIYGCLLLFYTQQRRFLAEEVALAQAYADQVAQAIANARLQAHREQEATAAERNRLARELHDTVTQEIYSASLIAESLPIVWQTHRAEAEVALQQLHTLIWSALAGLRALLLELRPAALEQSPLSEALRKLGAAMTTRAGVPITVEVEGTTGPEPPLPAEVKVAFYRVAQESLMNAAKYARAHEIRLRLRIPGKSRLEMEIADDGQGFDPQASAAGHFGLGFMRDRAQNIGANLHVRSQAGQGTVVAMAWRNGRKALVPVRAEPGEDVTAGGTA